VKIKALECWNDGGWGGRQCQCRLAVCEDVTITVGSK
jgi:hypothetical protein